MCTSETCKIPQAKCSVACSYTFKQPSVVLCSNLSVRLYVAGDRVSEFDSLKACVGGIPVMAIKARETEFR